MSKFLMVTFNFFARPEPPAIAGVIDKAKDWAKFAPNCWVIKTDLSPGDWYNRLKPVIHKNDWIFIVEIDLTKHRGWLSKVLVDWINKDHSQTTRIGE